MEVDSMARYALSPNAVLLQPGLCRPLDAVENAAAKFLGIYFGPPPQLLAPLKTSLQHACNHSKAGPKSHSQFHAPKPASSSHPPRSTGTHSHGY